MNMPKIISQEKFLKETIEGRPPTANMNTYKGLSYSCGCGDTHKFNPNEIGVARELSGSRFVFVCQKSFLTLNKNPSSSFFITGCARFALIITLRLSS